MGFLERLGRIVAPLPEDLPPPTPPSQTFSGRFAQMLAPDEQAAQKADTLALGVEESKGAAPMDVERSAAPAASAAPPAPAAAAPAGKTPLKIGIRVSGANWEAYNAKHNVEQLIAEITGAMIRAEADSPVKFMHDYLAKTYPETVAAN